MAKKKQLLDVNGKKVEVSNSDKVFFPESGFTKGQVIDYYIRISPVLLPHLKNRPLTMNRFPDGIHGMHFYEKDAPSHTPDWVQTFEVPRRSGGTGNIRYILINDLPSLVWSANLANIEMHTFLAQAPKIQNPTSMVFDLDPGAPAGLLSCIEVALALREIFNAMELNCYAKVSGSKGLQLYVPLNSTQTYEVTRPFALAIAEKMEELRPDLVVSDMSKNLRKGKVLIDWSQNSDFKTTVAVYSLRAKNEKPSISMPVDWKMLENAAQKRDAKSLFFEPEEALKMVEQQGDLFAAMLTEKQKLPSNLKKVLSQTNSKAAKKKPLKKPSASSKTLSTYNAKRDFTQTKEPSGKKGATRTKATMFVIQKHEASRLHYDFRLEMEGVLRSWAVPKGVPTEKGDRRLAMHVEDHPMSYARFEGTIPRGNYGAGTVMVWDIGEYTVEGSNPGAAYRSGKITMILSGKKLKGQWTLVKSRTDERGKESWLLMKTGEPTKAISKRSDDESAITGRTMKQINTEASKDSQGKERI